MRQVLVDSAQLDIVHLAQRAPGHAFAEFMSAGILPRAQGFDELLACPIRYQTEARSYRRPLTLNAAGQLLAVALPAVLIRQQVFAESDGDILRRRVDYAG